MPPEKKEIPPKRPRYNPYEHITLSVRALDGFIIVCAILIGALIVIGIYAR